MKHKMTLEESDLRAYVEKILAMHGVKAADDIVFKSGKGQKVSGLHIDIDCEMAPEMAECPLCGLSRRRVAVVSEPALSDDLSKAMADDAPNVEPIRGKMGITPRTYAVDADEELNVDESLGESTVPPGEEDGSIPDDSDNVASMSSLTAINKRLIREKEQEARRNKKNTPHYSGGESTRPPEPGE